MRRIAGPGVSVSIPENWDDITDFVDHDAPPWTLADPRDGRGVVQFSTALFRRGSQPDVRVEDLAELLDEFAVERNLEDAFDRESVVDAVSRVGASFASFDDFIRAWYLSDGRNVVLATYACSWEDREHEAREREAVIRSVRLDDGGPA